MAVSNDRRLFERFMTRFPVKFKDTREDYGMNVFLRDTSAQGVKILSKERLFINDSISLDVKLPDGFGPFTLNGYVKWIKTVDPDQLWDYGLQFHKVDFMKLQRLYKFLDDSPPPLD